MPDTIDFSSFESTLGELERTHAYAFSDKAMSDPELHGIIQTAAIKGFEYSYALSCKFMERFQKRWPELTEDKPPTFHELLRTALEYKLISSIEIWGDFRKKRNITSHGYNGVIAEDIFAILPDFMREARALLNAMIAQEQDA